VTVEQLLAHADLAMYQAKQRGRDGYWEYATTSEARPKAAPAAVVTDPIRRALTENKFLLYLQPIVDLRDQRVAHYELLLRMTGAGGTVIPPGAFLEDAERANWMREIDHWVVREAIRLMARARTHGQNLTLEVNLSGQAFSDPGFLPLLRQELAAAGSDPAALMLEVTEAATLGDIHQVREFILALKSLGCRFAIDDFGKSFFTLYHLKHLPVDFVKIDGTLVSDLTRDLFDRHLVRAIVEVASTLHISTVAEGVSDQETVRVLQECGVTYGQGYYLGEPRPLTEVLPG
jgi:EAL domain-containing protein (putative c-di-GMP-specific phosphodiesterase class I)